MSPSMAIITITMSPLITGSLIATASFLSHINAVRIQWLLRSNSREFFPKPLCLNQTIEFQSTALHFWRAVALIRADLETDKTGREKLCFRLQSCHHVHNLTTRVSKTWMVKPRIAGIRALHEKPGGLRRQLGR